MTEMLVAQGCARSRGQRAHRRDEVGEAQAKCMCGNPCTRGSGRWSGQLRSRVRTQPSGTAESRTLAGTRCRWYTSIQPCASTSRSQSSQSTRHQYLASRRVPRLPHASQVPAVAAARALIAWTISAGTSSGSSRPRSRQANFGSQSQTVPLASSTRPKISRTNWCQPGGQDESACASEHGAADRVLAVQPTM